MKSWVAALGLAGVSVGGITVVGQFAEYAGDPDTYKDSKLPLLPMLGKKGEPESKLETWVKLVNEGAIEINEAREESDSQTQRQKKPNSIHR